MRCWIITNYPAFRAELQIPLSKGKVRGEVLLGLNFLSLGMRNLTLTEQSIKMAKDFEKQGIKPIDALHLATAAGNNIDYLCTCDDQFLKKANKIKNIVTKIILPTDLVREVLP